MAADKTDKDRDENRDDNGAESDKQKNETTASASGGNSEPEEVETEIVNEEPSDAEVEDHSGSETAHDEEGSPSGDEKAAKPGGMMSPGLILAGILVLVACFTLFSYWSRDGDDRDPAVAQNDASPLAAALDGAPEPGDPQDVPAGETPAVPSTTRDDTQIAEVPSEKTGNQSDEMKQAARTGRETETDAGDDTPDSTQDDATDDTAAETAPLTAGQLAQQRREAAAERARQRREGEEQQTRTAESEPEAEDAATAAPSGDAAQQTAQASGARQDSEAQDSETQDSEAQDSDPRTDGTQTPAPAREARPETATGAVTAEAETDTALQETRAALAEQRQTTARQAREIEALRREVDTALAEQDRRSQQRIGRLEQRIEQIQTQDVAAATKQAAIALAVSNLQRQMYSGRPYGDQLAVLERLTGDSAPVRQLRERAGDGLPPISYLQYSFLDAARSALAAARREEATSPLGRFWANFVGLFSVRRTGPQSGDSPSAIISRAEASLENGDLDAALRELSALDGEPADAMAPWIEEARARVEADQTLDALTNTVLSQTG
ncbi:mitofilin family membrane protein [Aquisalinus flavus]|uniref:Inner membrane protein n=1 Tax=Aquisalinus flavus TaxID=1526572 RepID=A0A8J2V6M8_9PROT|nr:mitofilin family membrane protein [Aquisalinus flavus]MBD0425510.1 hypothetical protein [Aquisalinus flavus]UNE48859.1 hypothetical protein FF099_12765 [Aquisalinus flavus]GGD15516.1 hypothetical protein GCM10011342_25330 [Aquisalinus flavus]